MSEKKLWSYAKEGDLEGIKRRITLKGDQIINSEKEDSVLFSTGYTALHYAAIKGNLPIVQFLLSHGAYPNYRNTFGNTPLHLACISSSSVSDSIAIEIINTLIANGADCNAENKDSKKTPVKCARNETIRNALTEAIKDHREGKLRSYKISPASSSSQPASPSSSSSSSSTSLRNESMPENSNSQQLQQLQQLQQRLSMSQQQFNQEKAQLQQKITQLEQENAELRRSSASSASSSSQFVLPQFPLASLKNATNNFSNSYKLGEGGFGSVFKGTLLGTQVAIKKLASDSMQGRKEFKAEIISLSRFRHPCIVNLIGFVEDGNERCLVYEFAVNGSLRDRLDRKNNTPPLAWSQREAIAVGIAVGMNYLQNADPAAPFFRLDLKSANVLLDENFKPKLSDFGLTRPLVIGTDANNYAKTNSFEGDLSYCCPEYKDQGKVSRKTDVYSYGCILIELLSGQFISNQLRSNIRNLFSKKKKRDLKQDLDPSILNWDESSINRAMDYASTAVDCIEEDRFERPSFAKIIQDLTGVEVELFDSQARVEDVVERECNICFDGPTDAKFIPCNHAAVCQNCAQQLKNHGSNCPICRQRIQGFTVGDFTKTFIQ